jgi:hypothetical protein
MRKCLYFVVAFIVVTLFTRASQEAKAEEKAAGTRTLKVKLHYTGAGRVDDQHKIFVVLFDSPEFTKGEGAPPFAMKSATAKDKTVTFSDFTISPVYAAASYDPTGHYDGRSGPPPSGSSLGMYSKTPGIPEPINVKAGTPVQIEIALDDSVKMH